MPEHPLPGSRSKATTSWVLDVWHKTFAATRSTSGQRPKEEGGTLPVASWVSVAVLQAACSSQLRPLPVFNQLAHLENECVGFGVLCQECRVQVPLGNYSALTMMHSL